MKAILIVHNDSCWAEKNYLTFDVDQVVNTKIIALTIDGEIVRFAHSEVIIVDLQSEALKAYEMDEPTIFDFLNHYAHHKGQSFEVVQTVRINGNAKKIVHPIYKSINGGI